MGVYDRLRMALTLRAQAFGPLANVEWTIPPGVSAVVGPNRAGKSTLLALPEFIRIAMGQSLNEAVKRIFDGPAYLRTFGLPSASPCRVSAAWQIWERWAWDVEISIAAGAIAPYCAERLELGNEAVLTRNFGAMDGQCDGKSVHLGDRSIPFVCATHARHLYEDEPGALMNWLTLDSDDDLAPGFSRKALVAGTMAMVMSALSKMYRSYQYEAQHLVKFGSIQSDSDELEQTGSNVFPLLRNWRDNSDTESRFDFVLSTLHEAFPHMNKVDFEQAGQTVTMSIRDSRWPHRKIPISRESTGLVTALLQLCAVASTKQTGLVTIDELETSLHPHAIRVLIGAFRRWAKEQNIRIVLATQSETVLDQFHDNPENIFVIEPNQPTTPVALTELFDGNYLNQFSLGDLFSHLEFGSNRDVPKPP